jgi:hypothetical protein
MKKNGMGLGVFLVNSNYGASNFELFPAFVGLFTVTSYPNVLGFREENIQVGFIFC